MKCVDQSGTMRKYRGRLPEMLPDDPEARADLTRDFILRNCDNPEADRDEWEVTYQKRTD